MADSEIGLAIKRPVIWVSLLRIFATLLIFTFHYQGIHSRETWHLDVVGISMFCFISGYLAYPVKGRPGTWLVNRFEKILIPYWSVILVVIIANYIVEYKEQTIFELAVVFFGGTMFLANPIYVISWYVTFILLMYIMLIVSTAHRNVLVNCIGLCLSVIFYMLVMRQAFVYLIAFVCGYLIKVCHLKLGTFTNSDDIRISRFSSRIFLAQRRCYSFFLLHGGVLLFYIKIVGLPKLECFIVSLITSVIAAEIHYEVSEKIIAWLNMKRSHKSLKIP